MADSRAQSTRSLRRRCKSAVLKGLAAIPVGIFIGAYYLTKGVGKGVFATYRGYRRLMARYQVSLSRLPKSKPLAPYRAGSTASTLDQQSPILRLPVEIRRQIYELALPTKQIFQPSLGMRRMFSYVGASPSSWRKSQYIRSDEEPPSMTFRTIIGLGGSYLDQIRGPPKRGCVHYGCMDSLLCGDGGMVFHFFKPAEHTYITDIMRTCHTLYWEVLDHLYKHNTISFFGPEMVLCFMRHASPEGLRRIRHAHFAVHLSSRDWNSKRSKALVFRAMSTLRSTLSSLKQLEIEIALTWGQPSDARAFWTWLKDDLLGDFTSLEDFVLKVSVLQELPKPPERRHGYPDWTPGHEPLSSWNTEEYTARKRAMTGGDEQGEIQDALQS